MNQLLHLSTKFKKLKASGKKHVPENLKAKILKQLEVSNITLERAAKILEVNPTTIYRWKQAKLSIQVPSSIKEKKIVEDKFIEVPHPLRKSDVQLFLELDLGSGSLLRIYR